MRAQTLKHPRLDCKINTPILIPSFSSKAVKAGTVIELQQELTQLFNRFAYQFEEAFLISAFDYHEGYVPRISKGDSDVVVFLDSGGYETSTLEDLSEVYQSFPPKNDWNEAKLERVLRQWPSDVPSVFVNFDSGNLRLRLEDQVSSAIDQKSVYPGQLWSFLIKPEHHRVSVESAIGKVASVASDLGSFDIIGVTEKELGSSGFERIRNVSKLRKVLDSSGITAPIHVFGSLDPTTVRLYFMAGAEIFDGLSWLRFSFHREGCGYLNEEAFKVAPYENDYEARGAVYARNVIEMHSLESDMRAASASNDTSLLELSPQMQKLVQRAIQHGNP